MHPRLSIVIPTHQRPDILQQCLAHLAAQTIAKDIEVIVVHDGTDDEETKHVILSMPKDDGHARLVRQAHHDVHYFSIPKSQQGLARNEGVTHATAPIVLFIGDDIFLAPDACEKCLNAHEEMGELTAVLGYVTWDPEIEITPVMRWLEKTGWQFGYPMISKYRHKCIPKRMQERFTYTSLLSVPRSIAQKIPFRTDATLYGWEDILWGKELKLAGIPLYFEPDAKAFHHHRITMEDSLKRMETLGRSLVQLTTIDPDLGRMPTGLKMIAYRLIALTPTVRGAHYKAFLRGIRSAR